MDGIPEGMWTCLGDEAIAILWDLMQMIYGQEEIPTEWRDSVIVPIYKGKGYVQDRRNYRGDKADIIYYADLGKDHEQFCFMRGRRTMHAIVVVRQRMAKHRQNRMDCIQGSYRQWA